MYKFYYYGKLPAEQFDIWFRHHLRRLNMTIEQYAAHIGDGEISVACAWSGNCLPSSKILKDMNLRAHQISDSGEIIEIYYTMIEDEQIQE